MTSIEITPRIQNLSRMDKAISTIYKFIALTFLMPPLLTWLFGEPFPGSVLCLVLWFHLPVLVASVRLARLLGKNRLLWAGLTLFPLLGYFGVSRLLHEARDVFVDQGISATIFGPEYSTMRRLTKSML